jgi:hypothetical protein
VKTQDLRRETTTTLVVCLLSLVVVKVLLLRMVQHTTRGKKGLCFLFSFLFFFLGLVHPNVFGHLVRLKLDVISFS